MNAPAISSKTPGKVGKGKSGKGKSGKGPKGGNSQGETGGEFYKGGKGEA